MPRNLWEFDQTYRTHGKQFIAGVDEAGRGPLAGPVVIAAVLLPAYFYHEKINDSKLLKEKERFRLEKLILKAALDFSLVVVDHHSIDKYNIRQATLMGMKKAVQNLIIRPQLVLIDGENVKIPNIQTVKVIHGDQTSFSIAAASILAKTFRDRMMEYYHQLYPQYEFGKHKGYGTLLHRKLIKKWGPSPIHRKSFLKKSVNW